MIDRSKFEGMTPGPRTPYHTAPAGLHVTINRNGNEIILAEHFYSEAEAGAFAALPDLLAALDRAEAQRDALAEALRDVAKAEGAYSRDRLTHAENTIASMKAIAEAALSSGEWSDQ